MLNKIIITKDNKCSDCNNHIHTVRSNNQTNDNEININNIPDITILPPIIQEHIKSYIESYEKMINGITGHLYDCWAEQINADLNMCEWNNIISHDYALKLRKALL